MNSLYAGLTFIHSARTWYSGTESVEIVRNKTNAQLLIGQIGNFLTLLEGRQNIREILKPIKVIRKSSHYSDDYIFGFTLW